MLAERVRRSLRAPMKIAGRDVVLTGSIGISVYDGQQATPADLVREAETAMYRAKRSGADRIELYKPEMRGERCEREDDRGRSEAGDRKAPDPACCTSRSCGSATSSLPGSAAQVRWQHPKLGSLSTAEFLPIAEETGQIAELSHLCHGARGPPGGALAPDAAARRRPAFRQHQRLQPPSVQAGAGAGSAPDHRPRKRAARAACAWK